MKHVFADLLMFIAGGASMIALSAFNHERAVQMVPPVNSSIVWLLACLVFIQLSIVYRRRGD